MSVGGCCGQQTPATPSGTVPLALARPWGRRPQAQPQLGAALWAGDPSSPRSEQPILMPPSRNDRAVFILEGKTVTVWLVLRYTSTTACIWLGFCPLFLLVPILAFPCATLCSPEAVRCCSPSPTSVSPAWSRSTQDPGMFLGQELGTSPSSSGRQWPQHSSRDGLGMQDDAECPRDTQGCWVPWGCGRMPYALGIWGDT